MSELGIAVQAGDALVSDVAPGEVEGGESRDVPQQVHPGVRDVVAVAEAQVGQRLAAEGRGRRGVRGLGWKRSKCLLGFESGVYRLLLETLPLEPGFPHC